MENVADFLKSSFAVLVFVIGLSVSFSMVSKVATSSKIILKNSDRNTYFRSLDKVEGAESRKVTNDTIISMINRIEKESFCVVVVDDEKTWCFDIDNSKIIASGTVTEMSLDEIINSYIVETIGETPTFKESFTEQVYEGIYKTADDGTTIVVQRGSAKLHITYTKEE